MSRQFYEFGPFRLDPVKRLLLREGKTVALTPKAFDTLLALVERSGQVMEKDELMRAVWGETIVEEVGLARNVSVLRKALGENPDEHRYIVTVPGRGYRFVERVRAVPIESADHPALLVETHTVSRVVEEEELTEEGVTEEGVTEQGVWHKGLIEPAPDALHLTPAASLRAGRVQWREAVTVPADAGATAAGTAPTTSSTKIIVGEIKRHKLATLVALLVLAAAATSVGWYWRAPTSEAAIDSIAVLPFANQNRAEEMDYLVDGLTESIINNLAQLPNLRVIARSSVLRYKGKETDPLNVGQELHVRAVVTGRLLQRGESLTISAELMDLRENKQLWGQQYKRPLADMFAVQGEIAKEISEKLRAKLSGAERQQLAKRPTESLKAFQYYTQGLAYSHRRTREDLLTAIRYYERAIEEDRNYALAYAGLANVYSSLGAYGYLAPSEGRRKAEDAARKALALDENLAEAHMVLGQVYVHFTPYSFSLGDRELRHAIELSPSLALAHWYLGISLVFQGRLDDGQEELLKARELDPLSPVIARSMAIPPYLKRDYVRALELLRQANELGPPFGTTFEIGVYIQNKLFNETLAELENAKRERKSDPILIYGTGMIYAARGQRAEALKIISELQEMSGESLSQAHWIAKIYATLIDKEPALTWLERGLAAGAIGSFYKDEPVWDPIRSDPRFRDLLRQMGVLS
jgi:TolB-like protein/DNA-binding winged helix-turn-helix (wHTH) protein/Tfp pilus assembly protein PilF